MSAQDQGSLAQAIQAGIDQAAGRWHTVLPGTVESYDPATGIATVRSDLEFTKQNPNTGELETYPKKPIPGIPVMWCGTQSGVFVPDLKNGDQGLILFLERASQSWRSGGDLPASLNHANRFHISDGVFIPLIRGPVAEVANKTVVDAQELLLGGSGATRGVARLQDTVDPSAAVLTWLVAVGTALGIPFPGSTLGTISSASNSVKSE